MAKLGDLLLHRFKILLLSVVIWSTKLVMADVPAIFIFGDSTVDVGTNNYVNGSLATANNPYYGIDYPHHIATGRFSNGYNPADIIGIYIFTISFLK